MQPILIGNLTKIYAAYIYNASCSPSYISGKAFTQPNWNIGTGEPLTRNNNNCGIINKATGKWGNRKCNPGRARFFVCEQGEIKTVFLRNNNSLGLTRFNSVLLTLKTELSRRKQRLIKLYLIYRVISLMSAVKQKRSFKTYSCAITAVRAKTTRIISTKTTRTVSTF